MGVIERHRFIKMDKDKESRLLDINEYKDALNCRIGFVEEGRDGAVENVMGNTLIYEETQAGTSRIIGTFEDESTGRVIYFLYNPEPDGASDAIYLITPTTDETVYTTTKIIAGNFLNFSPLNRITGIGVIGDLCYFTDGLNPQRVINLTRDYTGAGWKDILLHKIPPAQVPTISERKQDTSRTENYIAADNYQFAYRYVYVDNETSVFSGLSEASNGEFDPTVVKTIDQYVDVTVEFDTELKDSVKEIQLAYVKNNEGIYNIFTRIPTTSADSYTFSFYGDTVVEQVATSESSKVVEPIPFVSKALTTHDSRIFLTSDEEGYDVDDEGTTLVVGEDAHSPGSFGSSFKKAGLYNIGVIFFDERMRPTGVRKAVEYAFKLDPADKNATNYDFQLGEDSPTLKVTISGTPPEFAHYYQFCRTDELSRTVYQQVPVNVLLYWSEDNEGTPLERLFVGGDKRFVKPDSWDQAGGFKRVYLQIPRGVPFTPDTDTFVRVLAPVGGSVTPVEEEVIGLEGDYVVCAGNFGITDWTGLDTLWFVELFKKDTSRDNLYKEIGAVQPILNPGKSNRRYAEDTAGDPIAKQVIINSGDTYGVFYSSVRPFTFSTFTTGALYNDTDYVTKATVFNLESPTSIASKTSDLEIEGAGRGAIEYNRDQDKTIYVMDYSKPGDSAGRPNAVIINERKTFNNLTIRYSNTFIANSEINGLSNFDTLNQKALPVEYSPIRSLVSVKDNIISIHERHSNSLYTSEAFIKSAPGQDLSLTQSSEVIAQVRELTGYGRLGTIHPETVVQHEGNVYWFDAIHGCVVEYTNQGAFPISEMGMSNFFRNLSREYLAPETEFIWGGYDPRYDEYILTFSARVSGEDDTTIGYNTKVKAWTSRYSYEPEYYSKTGDVMITFKKGSSYRHNDKEADYNNFYGVQYERRLTFYVNQNPNITKVFTNLHLNAESIANGVANFNVAEVTTAQGQTSIVPAEEFELKEGVYRTFIFRDSSEDGNIKTGNPMRSQVLEVTLINNRTDDSPLFDAAIVYHQSHYSK